MLSQVWQWSLWLRRMPALLHGWLGLRGAHRLSSGTALAAASGRCPSRRLLNTSMGQLLGLSLLRGSV